MGGADYQCPDCKGGKTMPGLFKPLKVFAERFGKKPTPDPDCIRCGGTGRLPTWHGGLASQRTPARRATDADIVRRDTDCGLLAPALVIGGAILLSGDDDATDDTSSDSSDTSE